MKRGPMIHSSEPTDGEMAALATELQAVVTTADDIRRDLSNPRHALHEAIQLLKDASPFTEDATEWFIRRQALLREWDPAFMGRR
jgi:hypothetical protein